MTTSTVMAASRSPTVFGVHGFSRRAPVIGMSVARASITTATTMIAGWNGSPPVPSTATTAAMSTMT